MVELLVFCGFIAGVGAIIGKVWRGQTALGALLGFLLGPLGWALIYLVPDVRPKCLDCFKRIDPRATRCPGCGGFNLAPAGEAGVRLSVPSKNPRTRVCTCGAVMNGDFHNGEAVYRCSSSACGRIELAGTKPASDKIQLRPEGAPVR